MQWTYSNTAISSSQQLPSGSVGIVYKITQLSTGIIYIGKKQLYSHITKKPTAKEIKLNPKAKKKIVISESDWLSYWSSNTDIKKAIKADGPNDWKREIIHVCQNKISTTYWEVAEQVMHRVLFVPSFNGHISGKYYKGKII